MKSRMFNGYLLGEQTGSSRLSGTNLGNALEEATTSEGEEETLVPDRRGNPSPSQIVEQRLVALLAAGRPTPFIDAVCKLSAGPSARGVAGVLLIEGGLPRPDEIGEGGGQMNPSEPKVEKTGDVTIITFAGEATHGIENQIASELEGRTAGAREVHVLLDFTNVDRINSEEMGTLICLHKKVRAVGGRLTLFNLDPKVYEALTATHLQTLLKICRESGPLSTAPQDS